MDDLLSDSELMYLYALDVVPGVRGKTRTKMRRQSAGDDNQGGIDAMTTETETTMPLLYICHNQGRSLARTITCCEAYSADGVRLFRFDADTDEDEGILAAMTAEPDRVAVLAEKFPEGYDTSILGDHTHLPQDVWELHVRRYHDPRLWEGVSRQLYEGTFGPIDDEFEDRIIKDLIAGGPF